VVLTETLILKKSASESGFHSFVVDVAAIINIF